MNSAKMSRDTSNLGYAYQVPSGGYLARLKNALTKFSDIFSEFDKYIAPAYHHDRCERYVQMRLYSMHKREFVLVFLMFFAAVGLAIFIGLTGPPISVTTEVNAKNVLPKNNISLNSSIATGPFIMKTPTLTTYNQQLWLIAKFSTKNTDEEIVEKSFDVSVAITGLNVDHKPENVLHDRNKSIHIKCAKETCDEFLVLHLGYFDYTHYITTVNFFGLEIFHSKYTINELFFYFKTYNPDYTQIEIWFRLIFLIGTFSVACWFFQSLRKYPMHVWSYEQRWMSLLLPLMAAFDNPFFAMIFMTSFWLPGVLDAMFQITFTSALFLAILCIPHGIIQNERNFYTFYLPKLFIVGLFYFPLLVIIVWMKISEVEDPTFDHKTLQNFPVAIAFLYISIGMYIIYLIYLTQRAYTELRSMPYFAIRIKFLFFLSLILLVASFSITATKFGIDILEDHFISDLKTSSKDSVQFMSQYGLLNFYIYALAYVYSPNGKNAQDSAITKDNPAFSMINDSDEDVIYGPEQECRRPLNRTRADDDSD